MSREFQEPRPNRLLMWVLGYINRWFLLLGLPFLRWIPGVRDLPGIRGYFWVRRLDLPEADLDRLRRAVNPGTAAFIGPNHPEFGFDWMMDKELTSRVAPGVASWAASDIIRTAPGFWLRNNLIANTGGPAAMTFSVDRALAGDAVLLHPEGSVHWTNDRVHPLFGGIAEMACEAARRAPQGRPVYIVPVVWRIRYARDINAALHREMTRIERYLGLEDSQTANAADRFRELQRGILVRQMRVFGFDPHWVDGLDFFARQDAFRDWLVEDLETRYPVERCDSVDRLLARIKRAIPKGAVSDRARLDEAVRLGGFSREVYDRVSLSQEQMAESLKRHRATLMRRGWKNMLHNYLPSPLGPRVVQVRVPEPILVDPARANDKDYPAALLALTHDRMQSALADTSVESGGKSHRIAARSKPSLPQRARREEATRLL